MIGEVSGVDVCDTTPEHHQAGFVWVLVHSPHEGVILVVLVP